MMKIIFAVLLVFGFSAAFAQSPLEQMRNGVAPDHVQCDVGFQLIVRTNNLPACVKPTTADILDQRGMVTFVGDIQTEPPVTPPTPVKEEDNIIDANNRFMLDFYSTASQDDNVFYSPWSILSAFSLVYEGARGDTADQIGSAMYLPRDDSNRKNSFASIQQGLNPNSTEYELANANALWIKNGFEINPGFVDTARQFYGSEVANVEFPEDESAIDSWVANKTNDKIQDLIKGKTDELTRLVITNAVYFNGTWQNTFNPEQTSPANFTVSSEKSVEVPMMYQKARFEYSENDDLQVLKMPYKGDRLSMLVLLPKSGVKLLDSMTVQDLQDWRNNLQSDEVYVYMPKFKLETEYDLMQNMKALGVEDAFDPNLADLGGMADQKLYIGAAVHKAFVDVNEVGTEAAAATGIVAEATSAPANPIIFRADHPFVFLIQDDQSGLILFMGKLTDPSP